jgi:hypothetical protein
MLVKNPIKALRAGDGRTHKPNSKRVDYDNILAITSGAAGSKRGPRSEMLIWVGCPEILLDESLPKGAGPLR